MRMVSGIIVALMALSVSGVTPYGEARRFVGHTGIINSLAFSPDETLIASGSNDRTVRIWDVASGKQLHKLEGHTDMVNDLVFSSDGKRLFSSGMDGQARIWDVKTGELLFVLQKRNGRHIHAGAMSPDGKFALLGSCDATLELWDVEKEKMIRSMNFVRQIDAVAFAPDSQRFFVGCEGEIQNGRDAAGKLTIFHENSGIWVFDIAKEDLVKQVADHGATSIQFSADGRTVAFLGDNAIWRMDSRTFEILGQFKPPQHQGKFLDHFALSADGKNAMGCLGHATYYLNLDANRVARAYLPFHEILLKTALSPKGHWAAVAGGGTSRAVTIPGGIRSDAPSVIRLFDLTDGWEPPRYLAQKAPTDTLEYVQYTPDDRVILTISHGGALGLWDLSTRKELSRFEISKGHHMVIFDSGKQLARWIKKVIELYDVPSGKKIADIPSPNSDISTAAPSADGKTLYIAGGSSPTRTQAGFNLQEAALARGAGKSTFSSGAFPGRQIPFWFLQKSAERRCGSGCLGLDDRKVALEFQAAKRKGRERRFCGLERWHGRRLLGSCYICDQCERREDRCRDRQESQCGQFDELRSRRQTYLDCLRRQQSPFLGDCHR